MDVKSDRTIAFWLGCLVAVGLAILHRGHFASTDEIELYFQTRALVEERTLAVPAALPLAARGHDGRSYSHYTIGQALLAAPLLAAGLALDPLLPDPVRRALMGQFGERRRPGRPPIGTGAFPVLFYPPVATGVLAALFFLCGRRLGASRGAAATASLALAASTHAGLQSTLFLQHTTEAIGALGAFSFWHRARSSGSVRDLLLGSAFASSILNVRVAGAISGLALGGYLAFVVLDRMRRGAGAAWLARATLCALLPLVTSGALYLLVNRAKWGTWLESPMLDERSRLGADPGVALAGFLLSPGMSVFVYSPLLLLLPATLRRLWRTHRAETITILALFASNLLFYASYQLWTGLYSCPGPRYLVTGVVLLMLPLGPWLDSARAPLARASFLALAALGAGVQVVSASVSWGDLVLREGYQRWRPSFGFLFDADTAPLAAAWRHLGDPYFVDAWVGHIALGWPGQAPAPGVALAIAAAWGMLVLALALQLRRVLRPRA